MTDNDSQLGWERVFKFIDDLVSASEMDDVDLIRAFKNEIRGCLPTLSRAAILFDELSHRFLATQELGDAFDQTGSDGKDIWPDLISDN